MRQQAPQVFAVIVITVVGVRRGHHVGDAIGRRSAAHRDADVPGFGPVVYLWKNMRMNIDHNDGTPAPERCCATFDLSRFAGKEKATPS
jgi:hypothetical protein